MYSGSDSTGSQNYNQWPLNPAAYQNTPNDQIDWAALAQQWIIMKEAGPPVPDQILTAPPPPNIRNYKKKDSLSEGGEAPMEVENDKEDSNTPSQWSDNNTTTEASWNWNQQQQQQQQQQWGWGNSWSTPAAVPPPGASKAPLLPTPPSYNQYSGSNESGSNFGGFNRNPSGEYSSGYWTASGNKLKPHNKRYNKVNVPPRPTVALTAPDPVMLDATKRKQLPAWIREGLEKMERDKQRQLEKEREKQEKEEKTETSRLNEKEAMEIIKSTVKERERSKFDSEGEDSEYESNHHGKGRSTPETGPLTQEELMLKLRRTMTEVLLEVTDQEIWVVCKEEFQRHLRKSKASDLRVSAASGTNISSGLGLGIYGDSASSSEDSDDSEQNRTNNSDAELKDIIKRRKAEFTKTEREIEERLAAADKRIDDNSRGGTPKADSCDSQVDAKSQGSKGRLKEETAVSRTVGKKFKKHRTSSSSSSDSETGREERRTSHSKRSPSTDSSQSIKIKSRNKRNRSGRDKGSATPERRKTKERQKVKYSESSSSKSSSSHSRKSRSKSPAMSKRSRSRERSRRDSSSHKEYRSKRSHSRSSSRSDSRSRSSRSYSKTGTARPRTRSERSRRSRSQTRSEQSRRSRSAKRRKISNSRRRSKSYRSGSRHRHRSRSRSSSRGKRSHRH